jgi:hypothetical protein
MRKKKIAKEMLQKQTFFEEILDKAYGRQTQEQAKEILIEFFRELQRFEPKDFGETDLVLDDNLRRINTCCISLYPEFLFSLGLFRRYWLDGNYKKAVYYLDEVIALRPIFFKGSRASILEAGKQVMGNDFPKEAS